MGKLIKLGCTCGYEKELSAGEGIMAKNKNAIRQEFSNHDLLEFENALLKGMDFFRLRQQIHYCAACKDIVNITVLKYEVDGQTRIIAKPCPDCGKQLSLSHEATDCPKCGKKLNEELVGFWD